MDLIKIRKLSNSKGPIVGFSFVAHESINQSTPAVVGNGTEELKVPLSFYSGDLNLIRTELHHIIDTTIDALLDDGA